MNELFDNYDALINRVDALCVQIETALAGHLTCQEGCSSCCLSITLFPVEAHALRCVLDALPQESINHIRERLKSASGERCPLLADDRCLLYHARPVICRTHGLPILYREDAQQRIDICPRNQLFGVSIKGQDVIDLDRLNSLLVAVNSLYLAQCRDSVVPERLSILDALLEK